MGKKNPFSDMTCEELKVAMAKLGSGSASVLHVLGDFGFCTDVHTVMSEMHEAYRERWNRENPKFPVK